MANTIKLKNASGSDPSASDLVLGELAVRTDTGKIFLKKDNGNVAEVSGGGGVEDGDKGDITVSNSGDTWTIDAGAIDNANISSSAAIAYSKLANISANRVLGRTNAGAVEATQVHTGMIADDAVTAGKIDDNQIYSSHIVNGTIVNGDINASAAIAGTKISPDFGSQAISTTGNVLAKDITLTDATPSISFTDNDGNPDYQIVVDGGALKIHDDTNDVTRLTVNTDGHVDVGHLDVGNALDVAGNITVTGTVDGVDIATRNTLFGGLTSSSGVLTNGVTATTQSASDNSTKIATTAYTDTAISNLINGAPAALDTLNELAAAMNDDAAFSTTVTNSLATKLPLAGGQITGNITCSGSQTFDGRDLSTDGSKLDGIESGATADQTGSEIRALLAATSNTNILNDTLLSKLNGIESGATADQSASEILTLLKTVDGSGSGLDADTLDGVSSGSFARRDGTNMGATTFEVNDADFIVKDDTDSTTNYIWRDHSHDTLYLGTAKAVITPRSSVIPSADSTYNIGTHAARWANGYFDSIHGEGSNITGVNATTLDSIDSGSFLRSDADDTASGDISFAGELICAGDVTVGGGAGAITVAAASDIRFTNGSWTGESAGKIQHNSNWLYIQGGTSGHHFRSSGGTNRWTINSSGHLLPGADSTYNIGSSGVRVANGYFDNITITNDGAGSGIDADLLDGAHASVSASNSTIVQRHSSGYIFANYFNTTPNDVSSGVTRVCVETGNDGYIRHGTAAAIRSFINVADGATNVSNNNQLTNGAGYTTFTANQAVDTGSSPTFHNVYVSSWFRNNDSGDGLYNTATGQHWYSDHDDWWNVAGGGSANGIRFRDDHGGTIRGYVYANNSNEVGFLDSDGNWAVKVVRDSSVEFSVNNSTEATILPDTVRCEGAFFENSQTVAANKTISNGYNAMSAGPITINSSVTVTVGSGETWSIV